MRDKLFLFTLHESKEDHRIKGAVLARSAVEAASILGGEYVRVENQPPGSSTYPDDLNLCGKMRFASELFREFSSHELSAMGLDYYPGRYYEKWPGFHIWEIEAEKGREFILRRNDICTPEYVWF